MSEKNSNIEVTNDQSEIENFEFLVEVDSQTISDMINDDIDKVEEQQNNQN